MRALSEIRSTAVVLCPLVLLSSSSSPSFVLIGVCATTIAFIAAVVSLASDKVSIYALMIGVITLGLIAVGSVSRHSGTAAYVQAVQLLAVGTILADHRKLSAGLRFYLSSIASVVFLIAINFSMPKVFSLIVWNRSWATNVFENPNLFGMSCTVLMIYAFLWSRMVTGTQLRSISYLLVVTLILFIAASGSRTALFATVVFFSAYFLATAFAGDKRLLWAGAGFALLMVPLVTFGLPMVLGVQINLVPRPQSQGPPSPILSAPVCVQSAFAPCPVAPGTAKLPKLDSRAGGFLGLKKEVGTGREKIWPAVIEMAALSPVLGHGLGAFPGAYLAPPYTGLHAHSGFVQAYYQFGLVGLGLYVLLWCVLFSRAIGLPDSGARAASVAVLCAACVLDTFEVIFLQANLGIGMALGILATTEFAVSPDGQMVSN